MGCIKTCHGLYFANSCSVHQTPGARAECSPVQTHTRPCHSRGLEMGGSYPPAAPPGVAERERLSMDVVQVSEISKGTERWSSAHSTTEQGGNGWPGRVLTSAADSHGSITPRSWKGERVLLCSMGIITKT